MSFFINISIVEIIFTGQVSVLKVIADTFNLHLAPTRVM
jgi:hypothetical protein